MLAKIESRRKWGWKTYKEIAQVMNITESDVKINIFRARKSIKEHLAKISKYGL